MEIFLALTHRIQGRVRYTGRCVCVGEQGKRAVYDVLVEKKSTRLRDSVREDNCGIIAFLAKAKKGEGFFADVAECLWWEKAALIGWSVMRGVLDGFSRYFRYNKAWKRKMQMEELKRVTRASFRISIGNE